MSRFQFVADHSATFEVKRLCELVEIERSSFYAWLEAAPGREARAAADAELVERIRAVHAEDDTCGAPRITAELNDGVPAEERVNHKRVARVMRVAGIRGYVEAEGPHHDPRAVGAEGPRPARSATSPPSAEPALRRRHHLPAARRRHATCTWPP